MGMLMLKRCGTSIFALREVRMALGSAEERAESASLLDFVNDSLIGEELNAMMMFGALPHKRINEDPVALQGIVAVPEVAGHPQQ
jgi:hypothetical protein